MVRGTVAARESETGKEDVRSPIRGLTLPPGRRECSKGPALSPVTSGMFTGHPGVFRSHSVPGRTEGRRGGRGSEIKVPQQGHTTSEGGGGLRFVKVSGCITVQAEDQGRVGDLAAAGTREASTRQANRSFSVSPMVPPNVPKTPSLHGVHGLHVHHSPPSPLSPPKKCSLKLNQEREITSGDLRG